MQPQPSTLDPRPSTLDPPAVTDAPVSPPPSTRQFLLAVALGLAFITVVNVAVRYAELVTGRFVTGGVPPVAACGALVVLLGIRTLLRRWWRIDFTRDQLLVVYSMVALGTFLAGAWAVRAFLPHLVTVQYWSGTRPALAPLVEYLPTALFPRDPAALRRYFQGEPGAGVPWGVWLPPLALWSTFWVALFGAGWCLMLLFRRQWLQHERLGFPLLTLPLALTAEGERWRFGERPLWSNPVLWLGVGAAALFNGLNIGHALWPNVPAPGFYYQCLGLFSDRSLAPLNYIAFFYMPEAIGFGYFVPLDISFSIWFFYLLERLFACALVAGGYEAPGAPFMQEQSGGGYLAMGALILAGSRQHLVALARQAFFQPSRRGSAEDREARAAWLGLAVCAAYLLLFMTRTGLPLRIALPFLAILACFMLVYARLRAETGVPFEFIHPFGMPKELLLQTLSVPRALEMGGPRALVALSSFAWLSRPHPGHMTAAHQIDAMRLSTLSGLSRRRLGMALATAFIVGLALACWSHLGAYYDLGSNVAGGGMGAGEFRAKMALQEFERTAQQITSPPEPDYHGLAFAAGGAAVTLGLSALRHAWLGSPFHPLGFILANACSNVNYMFFSMLVAWLLKATLLRAGGLRLYRAGLPFFLGLILGHVLLAGVLWPLLSLLLSPEASATYQPHFG